MVSSGPVQTGLRPPPIGSTHQSGGPPQLAPPGPDCGPRGLSRKSYHTSPSGGPRGYWRRRRETPCTASFHPLFNNNQFM